MFSSLSFIIILIFSVVLHELAHGYTAYKLGDPTAKLAGRLTLNPLPHLDIVGSLIVPGVLILLNSSFLFGWAKPVPVNTYNFKNPRRDGAFVALAGPVTNIILASLASLALHQFAVDGIVLQLLQTTITVNVVLAVFNMFPVPPLDGHHILFAILPRSLDHIKVLLRQYSSLLVLGFIIFGAPLINPIIYRLINFFL